MTGFVTLYATFADAEEAARIARILVEERLAACANILGPIRSIYRWKGRIEDGAEVAALFKTTATAADRAIARLAELHSFKVAAAAAFPITHIQPTFGAWIAAEVEG
ncbi:MAG: divalent-cation tolerance protein CutA [Allosphingosinicella sp.]